MPSPEYCIHQPSNPLEINPVPDITGYGVLAGFISMAYILLCIILVYYIFGYDPTLNPFGDAEHGTLVEVRPNPFDQLVLKITRRILCIDALQWQSLYRDGRLAAAFDKCAVNMADIQIVNGLAILITGLALLPQKISALHWKMIVYLSWFSCITNLSALTFLRSYLIRHPFERAWRLISTFVLLVILIVALVPTGHFFWDPDDFDHSEPQIQDAAPSSYAICYFNTDFKGTLFAGKNSMILSILLLVLNYTAKVFRLYGGFRCDCLRSRSLSDILIDKCLKSAAYLSKPIGNETFLDRAASNVIVAAHFVVCIWIDVSTSTVADIFWLVVSLAWGTIRTDELRYVLDKSSAPDDTTWSFGQILPVLLIAGPLLILIRSGREAFAPAQHEDSRESIIEPRDYGSNVPEAGIIQEQNQGVQPQASGLFTQPDVPNSNKSNYWILDPAHFTEYYDRTPWLKWAPAIYVLYTAYTAANVLFWQVDPITMITNFIVWFTLVQGSVLHYYILICSCVCTRWRHPAVHIAMCGLLMGMAVLSYLDIGTWFLLDLDVEGGFILEVTTIGTVSAAWFLSLSILVAWWISWAIRRRARLDAGPVDGVTMP
ncbi:uncharacterized protein F4822DRAFT_55605 [Hypoxylon trugodes]|uniref:uncharacterized protein n=1 Tax=Hypoxylon trugodes TaxID=326681 RepID=UPI00219A673E|nr:uncharacterized protein F4822DRAFT_55605 [Hypoxylon trugodes]KAI1383925.1 hypothetical protein F4822DRAFT_55605 [Hypoxylon trugodes]